MNVEVENAVNSLASGLIYRIHFLRLNAKGSKKNKEGKKGKISVFFALFVLFALFASSLPSTMNCAKAQKQHKNHKWIFDSFALLCSLSSSSSKLNVIALTLPTLLSQCLAPAILPRITRC
jgi:hypothetical protein